ncbi:MAG: kynureninase, partial [Acidimicrobiales bacterium]
GCTYKYLNGGPGAPAFSYVRRGLHEVLSQPIRGWWSHHDMFEFDKGFVPADDVMRFAVGTPPILSLTAVRVGVELTARAGIAAIRTKSLTLTETIIRLAHSSLGGLGFSVATPTASHRRGSHVALRHDDALAVTSALRERRVITDFRAPDTIRLGVAPLYTSHLEVVRAIETIREVATGEGWGSSPGPERRVT